MKFSERMGLVKISAFLQRKGISERLTNELWNIIYRSLIPHDIDAYKRKTIIEDLLKNIQTNLVVRKYLDNSGYSDLSKLKKVFITSRWYDKYDILELIAGALKDNLSSNSKSYPLFISSCNQLLEQEHSAYRFVDGAIVPITNDTETETIEGAVQGHAFENAMKYIEDALAKISDKQKPDYPACIDLSLLAILAILKQLTGEDTLDKAIPKLDQATIKIPDYIKSSLNVINSAVTFSKNSKHLDICFEDAKFVLVNASSFINYIVAKQSKII